MGVESKKLELGTKWCGGGGGSCGVWLCVCGGGGRGPGSDSI